METMFNGKYILFGLPQNFYKEKKNINSILCMYNRLNFTI